jgi:hypothetical protein
LNLGEQGVGFHGLSRLVDVFSLQGQRGIWQSPGDTWLIATHWAAVAAFMPATVARATLIRLAPRQSIPRVMERRMRFAIGCLVWLMCLVYRVRRQGQGQRVPPSRLSLVEPVAQVGDGLSRSVEVGFGQSLEC